MIERTKRSLRMTNSTSGGKSPELTTSRLVKARGSEGQGAMLNLDISDINVNHTYMPRPLAAPSPPRWGDRYSAFSAG